MLLPGRTYRYAKMRCRHYYLSYSTDRVPQGKLLLVSDSIFQDHRRIGCTLLDLCFFGSKAFQAIKDTGTMNNLTAFVDTLIEPSRQSLLSTEVVGTLAILLSSTVLFVGGRLWRRRPSPLQLGKDKNGVAVVHPPHVRSYVPYLGSAIEMGKNIRKFIAKYGDKLKTPVFTATIAGDHCLFISDPDNVLMVHRYAKYLDDLSLQKQFVKNVLGLTTENELKEVFHTNVDADIKQYHKYLFTNDELQKTVLDAQQVLGDLLAKLATARSTTNGAVGQQTHPIQSQQHHWITYNLSSFVREYVFKASVHSLISKYVASDEASDCFKLFDEGIPLLFAGAPSFLTKKATEARDRLVTFLNDPDFVKQGSDLIVTRHAGGWTENVFARSTLGVLFASVGNSIPAVFWVLYHLLADPQVYEAAKVEVQSILDNRPKNADSDAQEYFTLEELNRMVVIKSMFTEALRMYGGAFTTREAVQDFVFDPKTNTSSSPTKTDDQQQQPQSRYLIEKGTRIMAFAATMHYDPEVFEDPESFQYDRFLPGKVFEKNGKRIAEPVRPFGGGAHLCPGRKFIAYEIQAFLAMLVSKMEMRLVQGRPQDAPQIDFGRQGVGVSQPDRDVGFEIRFR